MPITANEYGPFDAGAGASVGEAQWSRIFASVLSDGKSPGILGSLLVTQRAAGANMSVDVATGQAFIQGHQGRWASVSNLSISSNSSGSTRFDSIVVRSRKDSNVVELDVVAGAAASATATPTLTQDSVTWEVEIARVAVGNGATSITNAAITNKTAFAVPPIFVPSVGAPHNGGTNVPTLTSTFLPLATPFWDTGGFYSASATDRLTLPKRGVYIYGGMIGYTDTGADVAKGVRGVTIAQNGGTSIQSPSVSRWASTPTAPTAGILAGVVPDVHSLTVAGMGAHNAGEYLSLMASQTRGSTLTTLFGFIWCAYLGVFDA